MSHNDRTLMLLICAIAIVARRTEATQIGRPDGSFGYVCPVIDLGPRARVAFAAAWIAGQAALILSAARRPDHAFGFRMFPEASTIEIHLSRETEGGSLEAPRGEWSAWRHRVRDPILASVDTRVFASYGVDAQLARLQRALDDVADHLPDDAETLRVRADVVVRRNGRDPTTVTLASHTRREALINQAGR
jgi:hypothetical protein